MQTGKLFLGDDRECRAFLRKTVGHYVYVLRRPDGRPFYVGKGQNHRAFDHDNEARHPNDYRSNPFKLNVIRKIKASGGSIIYEVDFISSDETAAFAREMHLISGLKRLHEGGPLTNLDPGGGSTAGATPFSKQRHAATLAGEPADNPARAILNRFVLNIAPMRSVIFKPVGQFVARPTQRYPAKSMAPTLRQAVAIVASAAVNGVSLDGSCRVPRRVIVDGIPGLVENGVSCDLLTSGLAEVIKTNDPAEEVFHLSANQARQAAGLVGFRKCVDLGLLPIS